MKNTKFFGSKDNVDFYPVDCDIEKTARPAETWFKSVFTPVAGELEPGTHFLKLQIGANSANWNPQLSQVSFTYGKQKQ